MPKWASQAPGLVLISGAGEFVSRIESDLAEIARSATGQALLGNLRIVSQNRYCTVEQFTPALRALWNVGPSDGAVAYVVPSAIASYGAARRNEALLVGPSCGGTKTISRDDCRLIRDAHANRLSIYTAYTMGLSEERSASARDGVAPTVLFNPFEWRSDPVSSDEALLHEFIHCLQCLEGRTDVLADQWSTQRREAFWNPAEEEAMRWQNRYRAERKTNSYPIDYFKRRI
ncbi:MAG: hypothetical protein IPL40_00660 [Proteobacteria bacterium]|nr:hypothetical protein [Pseudomonadota bacterium]